MCEECQARTAKLVLEAYRGTLGRAAVAVALQEAKGELSGCKRPIAELRAGRSLSMVVAQVSGDRPGECRVPTARMVFPVTF